MIGAEVVQVSEAQEDGARGRLTVRVVGVN